MTGVWNGPMTALRALFVFFLGTTMVLHAGTQPSTNGPLILVLLGLVLLHLLCTTAIRCHRPGQPKLSEHALTGERGKFPFFATFIAMLLLALGWISALQPRSIYDRALRTFLPLAESSYWPWGTVEASLSLSSMLSLTALFGALVIAHDLGSAGRWRNCLIAVVVGLGISVVLLGLMQRAYGDVGSYWGGRDLSLNVLGPFWYHGNAGAFLNMCWPLAAAGTLHAAERRHERDLKAQFTLAAWVLALLVLLVGVWINVSKAAQAIFLLQAIVLAAAWLQYWRSNRSGGLRITQWVAAGVFAIVIGLLLFWLGASQGLNRWEQLAQRNFHDARWDMLKQCLPWATDAGLLGYGPGTFSAVYVVKTTGLPDAPAGFWLHAHNDYLQMLLEWGWAGSALWLTFGGCILAVIIRQSRKDVREGCPKSLFSRIALLCGVGATALHAAFDFPLQMFGIQLVTVTLAGLAISHAPPVFGKSNRRRRKIQD